MHRLISPLLAFALLTARVASAQPKPSPNDAPVCGGQCEAGVALTVVGGLFTLAGTIMLPVAIAMTSDGDGGDLVIDTTMLQVMGGISIGIGAGLAVPGIVLLTTEEPPQQATLPAGEAFAIDSRPPERAARWWLGEF